uniref:restriction endonuclease subunit S n=1 Tax=Vibrio anguillarum TaxID=55601 RepID=UPI001F27F105
MEQVLNQLPKGWINVQVKDVTKSLSSGFACNKSFETSDGYVHLRTHNISTRGCLNFDQIIKVSHEKIDEKKSKIFKGEILFNNTNSKELVGKTAYVDQDYDFAFSNHLTRIVPNDKVHSKFLDYWLVSLQTSGYFNQICKKWIGQAGVNNTVLKGLSVPLPSKEEQRRIVEKLDALLTRIDTAIEHLQESVTLADALYASTINQQMMQAIELAGLSTVEKHIEQIQTGTTPPTKQPEFYENGDINWFAPSD